MIRIVKITLDPSKVNLFLKKFDAHKHRIKGFEGIKHLELLKDLNSTNTFFTYSIWHSEKQLNNYRDSSFFKILWEEIKPLFLEPAQAWSLDPLSEMPKNTVTICRPNDLFF